MLRPVARSALALLLLLSLLTWIYVPALLAWELSILTTQLGHWFALITLLFLFALKPWTLIRVPRVLDLGVTLAAFFAIVTFLAPLASTLIDYPGYVSLGRLIQLGESPTPFERFTFIAGNDKTPLNLDFYPPTENIKSPVPWVLVVHGGGWINGDSLQLPELNWHLNKRGYAVISIDYRLSPGWLWPAAKDDTVRALKFIREHSEQWKIDPKRWVILGRSAGAQIAGVVAYSLGASDRPRGYISFYGPSDLVFGYSIGQEEDILRSRTLLRSFLGGSPDEARALYESASVMKSVTPDACPSLLLHGLRDTLVYYKHSTRLLEILKNARVPVEYVPLRFGPHGFDFFFYGPESQVATRKIDHFLERVLDHAI